MNWPFLAIEAVAGAGKTDVRRHLFHRLADLGHTPLTVNEVSWLDPASAATLTAAFYRGLPSTAEAVTDAYVTDKLAGARRLVVPHLRARPVIADRYLVSDLAYQRTIWHADPAATLARYVAAGVPLPDATLFLRRDRDAVLTKFRAKPADQRSWWQTDERMATLFDTFESLVLGATGTGERVFVIDMDRGPQRALEEIDRLVVPYLTQRMPVAQGSNR